MRKIAIFVLLLLFSTSLYSQDKAKYQILTGFESDVYQKPYQRNFNVYHAGVGYKSNLTSIYGKVNLGYLMKDIQDTTIKISNQKQFEFDFYQSFSRDKTFTIWLNYAYSQDQLFPNHRISLEIWQKFNRGYLMSGGVNHYISTENVTFTNLGVERYFSRYWLEFKTYFFLKKPNIKTSYYLTGRMFFKEKNFLQVGVGTGSAQDEPFVLVSDLDAMNSYTGKIGYTTNTLFNSKVRLSGGFTYIYEEYVYGEENLWRNRYSFGVGLIYNIN